MKKTVRLPHLRVIDGLRGIGILLVVWYHVWIQSWYSLNFYIAGRPVDIDFIPRYGYLGVELLLFITGFGLFYPHALHMVEKTKLRSIKEYVNRRTIRILPSYYLALAAGIFFFTVERIPYTNTLGWQIFTHLTFIHTWFSESSGSISAVFWTIGTEIQFYLLFPVIAYFFRKNFVLTYFALVFLAYAFRMAGVVNLYDLENWLRQMPAFLDIYATGMLTAYLVVYSNKKLPETFPAKPIGTIMLVGCLYFICALIIAHAQATLLPNGRFIWLAYYRFVLAILFMAFTIFATWSYKPIQWLFTNKILIFLSAISYNLYLWHYMILLELKFKNSFPAAMANPMDDLNWRFTIFWGSLIISILVATAVTYLFEKPIAKVLAKIASVPVQ